MSMTTGKYCRLAALTFAVALLCISSVWAQSARELVKQGNSAYGQSRYDDAIEAYEKAEKDTPEHAMILLNKGAALYMKGEYNKAGELFEQCADAASDENLKARCMFNSANCIYKRARNMKDKDLEKLIERFRESIKYYRQALKLDPDYKEASQNIEIVRHDIKRVLDEIKKREQQARKDARQQKKFKDKIKELQKKLKNAEEKSKNLPKDAKSKKVKQGYSNQAEDQKKLAEQMEKLADRMKSAKREKPAENVKSASGETNDAARKMERQEPAESRKALEKAGRELEKALEQLGEKPGKGTEKKQAARENKKDSQGAKPMTPPKLDQHAKVAPKDQDVRSILENEKEARKRRLVRMRAVFKKVDKDW